MTIVGWEETTQNQPRKAVLAARIRQTVVYADIFDWPVTAAEILRFLPMVASAAEVREALGEPAALGLVRRGDLFALLGRDWLIDRRIRLADRSARIWPAARITARMVGRLPFIRSVAISGSLAMDAADAADDVDLFIVTAPGRLWLARAAAIGLGRLAALAGVRLCPNYLVSEAALALPEHDAYTARELAQLVPVSGFATYRRLLSANAWYREHTPNHVPPDTAEPAPSRPARWFEGALRVGLIDRLERWEMARKVARLQAGTTSAEQRFDADTCKGHFDSHRQRTLARYENRLSELGLAP